MLVLDMIWLGSTSGILYRPHMQGLIREDIRIVPALIFYALYAFGLSYLVIYPVLFGAQANLIGPSLIDLSLKAALLGLVAYGTYDLTGLAVIQGWSLKLSLIDMAWGAVVSAITANAVAFLLKMMGQLH
jgi:uncharacterized membrane protein